MDRPRRCRGSGRFCGEYWRAGRRGLLRATNARRGSGASPPAFPCREATAARIPDSWWRRSCPDPHALPDAGVAPWLSPKPRHAPPRLRRTPAPPLSLPPWTGVRKGRTQGSPDTFDRAVRSPGGRKNPERAHKPSRRRFRPPRSRRRRWRGGACPFSPGNPLRGGPGTAPRRRCHKGRKRWRCTGKQGE